MEEETKVLNFLYRLIKRTNGKIPTHHLKQHLVKLPDGFQNVVGLGGDNLHVFLVKHNEIFTVRRGITFLVKYDHRLQYGRVFSDMYGKVVSVHRIRLENEYSVFIPKRTGITIKLQIGDFVQCHASYGAHELQATQIRLVKDPDKVISPTSPLRDERNEKMGHRTYFGENLVFNAQGYVVQLSHQYGQLEFKHDRYKGDIYFCIDDYYEDGKKVLSLQWFLEVGDLVLFDAILEDDGKWHAGFVWKGLNPRCSSWADKRKEFEEYVRRRCPNAWKKNKVVEKESLNWENLVSLFAVILCFYVAVLWQQFF